ncbi:hypothetical protein D3C87_1259340 [compost metagenome]
MIDNFYQCKCCEGWKFLDEFPKHNSCKGGIDRSRCLQCKNEMSKASYHDSTREKKIFNRARSRAAKRGIEFDMSIEDIVVPDLCPVFGTPLDDDASIDRFIPSEGYVADNIHIISLRANVVKGNATLEELEAVVAWMKSKY